MPTIVYQTNANGTKYAYESTSYWDKEKKRTRTKRKYIGRVDPETGEIIPSKSRGANPDDVENTAKASCECNAIELCDEIRIRDGEIKALKEQLEALKNAHRMALDKLDRIAVLAASARNGED